MFRHFRTNNPLRRSEINRELHRLGQIARLGQVVTTGTIRRMVAEKIYALRELALTFLADGRRL